MPRKKERVSVFDTGVPITPGWKLKETEISTGTAFWSLNVKKKKKENWCRGQKTEEQGDFDGWSTSCVFEEQRGERENKRIHLRTGVKNVRRMEMRNARNRLGLLTQSSSNRARWKDPATVAAEVTNSPLQIGWIFCDWLSQFFIYIDVLQNRIHFSSFSALSTDCCDPGS